MAEKKTTQLDEAAAGKKPNKLSSIFSFSHIFFFGFYDDFLCFLLLSMFSFLRSKFARTGTKRKGPGPGQDEAQRAESY